MRANKTRLLFPASGSKSPLWLGLLCVVAGMILFCGSARVAAAVLRDAEVDASNVRVGTQTFGPRYHFSTNNVLVETAEAIRGLGSDLLKFYMGKGFGEQYPGSVLPASVTNLQTLARDEPSCRRVLDMDFRHYVIWTYCFAGTDAWWSDGFSASERQKEYDEVNAFARYLLTSYNHSGKSFYLGHWEGDWYLLPAYNTAVNPSSKAIQGMIDWLNTRQSAVDDAMRDVPHQNVAVYNYTEVNRVRDAMVNGPSNNQRLVNAVLPNVTNLDFVSWSSYDGMDLSAADLHATLDYIQAHLPPNKAAVIPGKRVWVGEYGWGGSASSAAQEPLTRAYLRKLLPWAPRFVLFWEMYDNENKAFWLIDKTGAKTPCYFLHQRLINKSKLLSARFKETNGRLPTDSEWSALLTPVLNQPLPAPQPLALSSQSVVSATGASTTVSVTLEQGIYGDEAATVWIFWGLEDGGTLASGWANAQLVAVNTHFDPTTFTAPLTNLAPGATAFFRFYATNRTSAAWATNTIRFNVSALDPNAFGCRVKLSFSGYTRGSTLQRFPALVLLSTNIAGFDYSQFASPPGGDLRFANASGTIPIPHEIDEWNTNGVSSVWVQVPSLAGTNESIWAFWGNPLATNQPATSTNGEVWSDGFELVWHLNEPGLPHSDSTLKHPATSGVNPAWTGSGAIGHGATFTGSPSYLKAGSVNLGERFTLSVWAKAASTANDIQTLWATKTGGSTTDGLAFFVNSWQTRDRKILFETGNGRQSDLASTPLNTATFGVWHHLVAVVDRSAGVARLFMDGLERTVSSGTLTDFGLERPLVLGAFADQLFPFNGMLDEARVETGIRSQDWIWASWMTVASNATFTSCASVIRQRPALSASAQPAALNLNWAASAVGYSLYTTATLAPAVWTLVTNQPILTGTLWQSTLSPLNEPTRYYRLQTPD
jgi:hypothetical protein